MLIVNNVKKKEKINPPKVYSKFNNDFQMRLF